MQPGSIQSIGSIEVDDTRPAVEIPSRLFNEMAAHARETYPEECCGLLAGDAAVRFRSGAVGYGLPRRQVFSRQRRAARRQKAGHSRV